MQPVVGQGSLNDAVGTHPPVFLPAARGYMHFLARYAQGQQMASKRPQLPHEPVVVGRVEEGLQVAVHRMACQFAPPCRPWYAVGRSLRSLPAFGRPVFASLRLCLSAQWFPLAILPPVGYPFGVCFA